MIKNDSEDQILQYLFLRIYGNLWFGSRGPEKDKAL